MSVPSRCRVKGSTFTTVSRVYTGIVLSGAGNRPGDSQHECGHHGSKAGNGWHIDRPAFNAMLRAAASAAGVTLLRNVSVAFFTRISTGWEIQTTEPSRSIECRFLVDASGRRRTVRPITSEKLPSRRTYDHLISIAASHPAGSHASTYTLIEA